MLTLEKVKEARERIGSSVFVSPCSHSDTFSELIDNSVFLKLENLQMTGSYKERGALNKILTLSESRARTRADCGFGGQPCSGRLLSRQQTRHSGADLHAHGDSAE